MFTIIQTEEVINQVLDEIGINLTAELVDAPTGGTATKTKTPAQPQTADGGLDMDLQARLDNLRKN